MEEWERRSLANRDLDRRKKLDLAASDPRDEFTVRESLKKKTK